MWIGIEIERGGGGIALHVRILLAILLLGAIAAGTGYGTYAAYTATSANGGNSFAAGSVAISDNDASTAMLSLANAKPPDADVSCIRVTYTGSLAAGVRLYGALSGSLPGYLDLTVTRGSGAAGFDDCSGFAPDATDYVGAGPGVLYRGPLGLFPTAFSAGLVDPDGSWTNGEQRWYRFAVSVQDVDAAQDQAGTAGFTWEARNL